MYGIPLSQRLPEIAVPLRPKNVDVKFDLQAILDACYADARYDRTTDYAKPPDPPLGDEDAAWARQVIEPAHAG